MDRTGMHPPLWAITLLGGISLAVLIGWGVMLKRGIERDMASHVESRLMRLAPLPPVPEPQIINVNCSSKTTETATTSEDEWQYESGLNRIYLHHQSSPTAALEAQIMIEPHQECMVKIKTHHKAAFTVIVSKNREVVYIERPMEEIVDPSYFDGITYIDMERTEKRLPNDEKSWSSFRIHDPNDARIPDADGDARNIWFILGNKSNKNQIVITHVAP